MGDEILKALKNNCTEIDTFPSGFSIYKFTSGDLKRVAAKILKLCDKEV